MLSALSATAYVSQTICDVTSLEDWFCMSRKGEVGWYNERVKTAWLCLGLAVKIQAISLILSPNGPRKQLFYLVGLHASAQGRS